MRQNHIDEGDFKILAIKDDNDKLLHFVVADRNEELLTNKKFALASEAIEWGNKFMIAEGLIR